MILEAVDNASEWIDNTASASAEEVEDRLAGLFSNLLREYFPTNLSVQS